MENLKKKTKAELIRKVLELKIKNDEESDIARRMENNCNILGSKFKRSEDEIKILNDQVRELVEKNQAIQSTLVRLDKIVKDSEVEGKKLKLYKKIFNEFIDG